MSGDYYQVLGVGREADQSTIKKAYRKMAMQFHPDKNPGDKVAEEKFKEAARAYEVLGNPDKRSRYDRFGRAGVDGPQSGGAGFSDVNDVLALLVIFLATFLVEELSGRLSSEIVLEEGVISGIFWKSVTEM
ncbi:MAG: DnaJ domain-containing protein [Bdellovibrionales bacterium]|nr:DnaJ domain-containing protein [Bdellovibrionales bacterium]